MAIDLAKVGAQSAESAEGDVASPALGIVRGQDPDHPRRRGLFESDRVTVEELLTFSRQLGLLLETGNSIVPSIRALAAQTTRPAFKRVLEEIPNQLEQGHGFSECLEQHPKVFDSLFVALVRAGEATGALPESLQRLSGVFEMRRELSSRFREAMTYPIVLTFIMVAVVIFLMTYMIPRFAEIFAGLGDDLPATTRMFIGSSAILRSHWWIILPSIGALIAGVGKILRADRFRRFWDTVKLRAPLIGPLYAKAYLFNLFSSFGLLLACRVPHLEAIRISRNVIRNRHYEAFLADLSNHVEAGDGLAPAFQDSPYFPDTVKLMISTGEASGALDVVMARLADRYRETLGREIRKASVLIEPVMLIVMGGLVGIIAISFILPILRMSQAVR
jgi:type II secretory pathway component PulF